MAQEIVIREIAGHKIALGLTWYAIEAIDDLAHASSELARKEKLHYGCVISSRGMAVAGLSKRSARAPSGAAWLATASSGEKVALMQPLGDGVFWGCAVKDGLPLPTFDVVGDLQAVASKMRPLANDETFKIFAPEGLLEGASQSDFGTLVQGVRAPKNIGVIVSGTSKLILLAIAMVLVGGVGYMWWANQQKSLASKNKVLQAQIAAQKAAAAVLGEKQEIIDKQKKAYAAALAEFEKKLGAPPTLEVAKAWLDAVGTVELRPPGWRASQIDCQHGDGAETINCSVTYMREKVGTMADMTAWLDATKLSGKVDVDRAFVAVTGEKLVLRKGMQLAQIEGWGAMKTALLNQLQPVTLAGISFDFRNAPAPQEFTARKPKAKEDLAPPLKMPASIGTWTMSGKNFFEVTDMAALVDRPGIQVKSLAVTISASAGIQWRMEGTYVSKQ